MHAYTQLDTLTPWRSTTLPDSSTRWLPDTRSCGAIRLAPGVDGTGGGDDVVVGARSAWGCDPDEQAAATTAAASNTTQRCVDCTGTV
jgi:hypothetical protein